jgi:hypothetical protein
MIMKKGAIVTSILVVWWFAAGMIGVNHAVLAAHVPSEGLVAYYPFDGNTNDQSANGNHGILHGAELTRDRFGRNNHAYRFDGVDDYIDLGTLGDFGSNMNSFTLSLWVKTTFTNTWRSLIKVINSGLNTLLAIDVNRNVYDYTSQPKATLFEIRGEGERKLRASMTTDIYDGKWHCLQWRVIDAKNNRFEVYVDGVQQSIGFVYRESPVFANFEYPVFLGAANNRGAFERAFQGEIDDVALYNRALTIEELSILQSGEFTESRDTDEVTGVVPALCASTSSPIKIGELSVAATTKLLSTPISYTIPENGRLVFTMNNPDSSRDGNFKVEIPGTGNPAIETQNFKAIPTYGHLKGIYDCNGSEGIAMSTMMLDVSRGQLDMKLNYSASCGLDNTGTDTLTAYFCPDRLPEDMLLNKTFTVSPNEQSSVSIDVEGPGEIVVEAINVGTFGGGDFVYYLDGYPLGSTQLYTNDVYATEPYTVIIPLREARRYTFMLSHEDDYWDDNRGTREARIFTIK